MNDENFCGFVAVLGIDAIGWLSCSPDVEPMSARDMYVLIRVFSHAGSDDGEIFFFFTARRARVDECGGTGDQILVAYQVLRGKFFSVHFVCDISLRAVPVLRAAPTLCD